MGVHGLWELLSPIGERVPNSRVRNKRIAIDASIWLTQFIRAMRDAEGAQVANAHLIGVFRRCCKLLFLNVKPVLVFDGVTPPLKRRTREIRRAQHDRDVAKLRRLAERLLMNQMRQSATSAVSSAMLKRRLQNQPEGPKSKRTRILTPSPESADNPVENINDSSTPDAEVSIEIPEDVHQIDDQALVNLPVNVQAAIFKQIRQAQRKQHRQQVMSRQTDPESFSKAQIVGFMKNTTLNRRIRTVRNAINDRSGANQRIASDSNRAFLLEEGAHVDNELVQDEELDFEGSDDDSLRRGVVLRMTEEDQQVDVLSRVRLQREHENQVCNLSEAANLGKAQPIDEGLGWAAKVLDSRGTHILGAYNGDLMSSRSDSQSDDNRDSDDTDDWECPVQTKSVNNFQKAVKISVAHESKTVAIVAKEKSGQADADRKYSKSGENDQLPSVKFPKDQCSTNDTDPSVPENQNGGPLELCKLRTAIKLADSFTIGESVEPRPQEDFLPEISESLLRDAENGALQAADSSSNVITTETLAPSDNQTPKLHPNRNGDLENASVKEASMPRIPLQKADAEKSSSSFRKINHESSNLFSDDPSVNANPSDPLDFPEKRRNSEAITAAQSFLRTLNSSDNNETIRPEVDMEYIENLQVDLERERRDLERRHNNQQRVVGSVTDEMITETCELLRLFGIPFLQAPFEAEAQCAHLEKVGLVDGVITEDSDAFLFGAKTVFRRLFSDGNFAEEYTALRIERELGVDQNKLIQLAYLLGSDYTSGVRGIGIVNAMEVLHAFPGCEELQAFFDWTKTVTLFAEKPEEELSCGDQAAIRRAFCWKHRVVKRNWVFRADFPDPRVKAEYFNPPVNRSAKGFRWEIVDFNGLQQFCWKKLGWDKKKFDEVIGPLRSELEQRKRRGPQQATIDEYFKPHRFAKIKSDRLRRAVLGMAGEHNSSHIMAHGIFGNCSPADKDEVEGELFVETNLP